MNNFGCLLLSHSLSTTLFEFLICTTTNLVPEVFFLRTCGKREDRRINMMELGHTAVPCFDSCITTCSAPIHKGVANNSPTY
jgi:hypothetical protein